MADRDSVADGGGERLLERDGEVAELDGFLSATDRPGPRLGLIEGPAGIGKTTLLGEGRRLARDEGMRVLSARGSELEREFPYGLVRQLFEPALTEPGVREQVFEGAAAAAAAVFERPGDEPADSGGSGFSTLHGLYWLALDLAGEEPLALVIDDLHWADSPSLRFLAYLLRRLEETEIVILGATRLREPGADAQLLGELADDPLTVRLRPGPLTETAVGELIEARLAAAPEAGFAAACREATGGNPLLLGELLGVLRREGVEPVAAQAALVHDLGPRAVSRAVMLRLGRLSGEAREVCRALAVVGEGSELWLLSELSGLDERQVAAATGELEQAEILRSAPMLGFVHPLVQAAVHGDLSPGERELEHARAARLLSDAGAPVERIASHLLSVGPRGDAWVAETLREAGRQAAERGAPDSAAAYLSRALTEPPPEGDRPGYLTELGLVQALTDLRSAVPTLKAAYASAVDPHVRVLIGNLLARALLFTGEPGEGAAIARRTIESLPQGFDDQRLGLLAFESAAAFFDPSLQEAMGRLEKRRKPAQVETIGEKAMAAVVAFDWANRNGPRDRCSELALASLEGGDLVRADGGLLPMYAIATLWLADREELMDAWEQMLAAAHRSGSLYGISTIHLWRGFTLYRRGELPEAEVLLREAVESFKLYGYRVGGADGVAGADAYRASILAQVLIARGQAREARTLLDSSVDPGRQESARYWLTAGFQLLMEEGRFEEAIAVAEQFPVRLPWNRNPTTAPWRSFKAQALARLDRREEAIPLVEEELELAREWGAPATVGYTLRVLGTLEGDRGIAHLEQAVGELERSSRRLELARALCELGTALRLQRRQKEAREPLLRALELADVCAATPLVERTRAELGAAGARPRTTALSGVEALTPSERRVADLAASGMTNREIAQELYVTPKTVEVHLSNAYRKLEVRGRRDLAGALAV